ncbi:MAG: hypothetical protein JXQ90_05995 [Cyclobacteriaceae bacterium]
MRTLTIIAILSSIVACETTECCDFPIDFELQGEWIQTERGYSPGSGYIIDKIPQSDNLLITFEDNNQLVTNIDGLTHFKYYNVVKDSTIDGSILILSDSRSDFKEAKITNEENSYIIEYQNQKLLLYYMFCFEGCHIGLERK